MDEQQLSPTLKMAITTAFNEGMRQLITSVRGIMPDDAILTNVITVLCVVRKECGFSEEDTRNKIVEAFNQNVVWSRQIEKFGGKQ
jgi:hypothetical protein